MHSQNKHKKQTIAWIKSSFFLYLSYRLSFIVIAWIPALPPCARFFLMVLKFILSVCYCFLFMRVMRPIRKNTMDAEKNAIWVWPWSALNAKNIMGSQRKCDCGVPYEFWVPAKRLKRKKHYWIALKIIWSRPSKERWTKKRYK